MSVEKRKRGEFNVDVGATLRVDVLKQNILYRLVCTSFYPFYRNYLQKYAQTFKSN